ncbi:RHS repeat-associated core domain-containing protein [Pseudomonas sp. SbOxS1]|uniref:RHS repeat-associated core domain-containing protein n=1 Tax=Pseudomonas sp. SbOxS1 TaxID=2723884 RepID=UPI00211EAA73|nr:RHS repeat-associated core domain-containing protein [Pseudomonas sp. SbOxS1]
MTSSPSETVLCHYHYDPLDRLISHALADTPGRQRFYCKSRLTTEIQGAMCYSIVQQDDQLLAQQRSGGDVPDTTLLATDQQRSVLQTVKANHPTQPIAYSPYGHRSVESGLLSLLGFNGERPDPVTGCYLLGNGYRAFNPVLMRFNSPDNFSPFQEGGLNSYAYCKGEPVNNSDSSGHLTDKIMLRMLNTWRNNTKILKQRSITPKLFITNEKTTFEHRMIEFPYYPLDHTKTFPITKISSAQDIATMPSPAKLARLNTSRNHIMHPLRNKLDFIYTSKKELYISTTGHQYLSDMTGNPELISAGSLFKESNSRITIDNFSGHFIPDFTSLKPVREYLEKLGVKKITTIRKWK